MTMSVSVAISSRGSLRDWISLTKPRVTSLVLATTAGGLWLAPGTPSLSLFLATMLGTTLVVAAANTLNCYIERDLDRLMARTRTRPLADRRIDARTALIFGLALGAVSLPLFALMVNGLTAWLAAAALFSYVGLYTPMKTRTPDALFIGAVPGALPPLMGWTAATGTLAAPGFALFLVLFFWQIPHFVAIAVFRQAEYTRAGMKVMPAVRGTRNAWLTGTVCGVLLLGAAHWLYVLGVAGPVYAVVAMVSGLVFLAATIRSMIHHDDTRIARQTFFVSLLYLPILFAALAIDSV